MNKVHLRNSYRKDQENRHRLAPDEALFQRVQENLGRGGRDYRACDQLRKSIFGGVAVCAKCGHALCSCKTVYKKKCEKYWYLSYTHQRQDIVPCEGGISAMPIWWNWFDKI